MSTVLLKLIATLDRLVSVEERQAAALERIATAPGGGLPPRTKRQRKQHLPKPPKKTAPIDDITRARARKLLRNAGVKP